MKEKLARFDRGRRLPASSLERKTSFDTVGFVQLGPKRFSKAGPSPIALTAIQLDVKSITHLIHGDAVGQVFSHK